MQVIDVKAGDISDSGPRYVVGIGASAGGLEALRSFFSAMPVDSGMAFVVIQHLAPDYKSLMVELLARMTEMPVRRAEEGTTIEANQIYLIPPRFNLTIAEGVLHLTLPPPGKALNLPIDIFFRSLAADCAERAIAIVLSGTGSDGARGIRAVKEAGGMVMVQDEASAKFAGMPSSAIATGTADYVLPVEEMPVQLVGFSKHPFAPKPDQTASHIPEDSSILERICLRLRETTGIDFGHYKQATLVRRIERRMNISQVHDIGDYLQYLHQSRTEAEALAKDLLISVTKFFRDTESFAALENQIPGLFERAAPRNALRIWSAGCATGEEAYSLGMLLETLRQADFPRMDLKVFATDLDRNALEIAGSGLYPRSVVADIPQELLEKYLVAEGSDQYRIVRPLRDRLIFARQDLMADPPFTKIDLIACRNLLIYLRPPAQRRLLSLFHFALQPGGLLFLGNSESLGDLAYAFETIDARAKIYTKAANVRLRAPDALSPVLDMPSWASADGERLHRVAPRTSPSGVADFIKDHLLNRFAPATIATTPNFQILYTMGPVQKYLTLPTGPARLDLLKMVPRELALAITTAGARALRESRPVEFGSVRVPAVSGGTESLNVQIEVLLPKAADGPVLLISLRPEVEKGTPPDATEAFDIDQRVLERVGDLEKELQFTRDNLQSSIEQQETANEELQAANEELLAANEELQSTNEELESVNEELYTVNAEYQNKIQELTEANDDIENLTRSTGIGTIFFDSSMKIRRFTPAFAEVTGLALQDIGRQAATFAHPVMLAITSSAALVKATAQAREEIIHMDGRGEYLLRIQRYRKDHSGMEGLVVSLVDIGRLRDAERELAATLETVNVGICVTDRNGNFVRVNPAYCRIYGYDPSELIGRSFTIVVPEPARAAAQKMHDDFIESGNEIPGEWDVLNKLGETLRVSVRASLLTKNDGSRLKITVVSPAGGGSPPLSTLSGP